MAVDNTFATDLSYLQNISKYIPWKTLNLVYEHNYGTIKTNQPYSNM